MIKSKKVSYLFDGGMDQSLDCRHMAYGTYLNLLTEYGGDKMLLLESLGPNTVDSRVSLIGINPVFNIAVQDCEVTISGNETLLEAMRPIFQAEKIIGSSATKLKYAIPKRVMIWNFLRKIDSELKSIEGGILAFISMAYNTIHYVEDMAGYSQGNLPDISLTCYECCIEFDEKAVKIHEYEFLGGNSVRKEDVSHFFKTDEPFSSNVAHHPFSFKRETSKEAYLDKAEKALHHIQIGDIYQVQIGQKIEVSSSIPPQDVYTILRKQNPSPYMYLYSIDGYSVVGASPELFVRVRDREVLMRPIAGTLGKRLGLTKHAATLELQGNAKEVAEHLMLVDLCRNDLSRVSSPVSLEVTGVMGIEEYSHVYHMVSTTKAFVKEGIDKYDVIKAAFPAGTMTGTPKIRAMEIIAALEDSSRGLYAGALGMIGLGVDFVNTALCIRTTIEKDGVYSLRASAGIVADSVPEKEHDEILHKMGSVFKAITGEEISCHAM